MTRQLTREYLIYKEGGFEEQLDKIKVKLMEIEKTFKILNIRLDFENAEIIVRIEGFDK